MGWVRLDDAFFAHRKVEGLTKDAKLLFLAGLTWCARELTDGFISVTGLRTTAALVDVKPAAARELVDAGLWHKRADGHDVHDYLTYQPTAEEERRRKQEHAERMRTWRATKSARKGSRDEPREPSRDMSHAPPRDGSRDRGGDGVSDALPDPEPQKHSSRRSVTHDPAANGAAPDGAGEEKVQVRSPDDPLVQRILAVVGEQPRHRREAEDLVRRARAALDERHVDEAIGRCEQADRKPRTVAFFETTTAATAAHYGVELPAKDAAIPPASDLAR